MRTISRRLVLGGLGAAPFAAAARAGAQGLSPAQGAQLPFHETMVEHVGTVVPDVRAATAFHSKVFNPAIMTEKNPTPLRCYVDLKGGYLAFGSRAGVSSAFFDHFCVLVEGYDQEAVGASLGAAGFPQNNPAFTLFPDPDGIGVQIYGDPGGWFPTVVPMEPIVEGPSLVSPHGLEYVMLNVADVGKSVAFYREIFGLTELGDGPWTWLIFPGNYVGLRKVPDGGKPGIDHIRVRVDPFDKAEVARQLVAMGAREIRKTYVPAGITGVLGFTDPQGLAIELMET